MGFKNSDNIKTGHRNIYINGGEKHPYCKPIRNIASRSRCLHNIPVKLLIYLNNHKNENPPIQCLANYVCPKNVTADGLAPFQLTKPDKTKVSKYRKNYLYLQNQNALKVFVIVF